MGTSVDRTPGLYTQMDQARAIQAIANSSSNPTRISSHICFVIRDSRRNQAHVDRQPGQIGGAVSIQLFLDVIPVSDDRSERDTELLTNLFACFAGRDQRKDLALSGCNLLN